MPTIVEGLRFGCIDWGDVAMETLTGCNPFSKLKLAKKVSKMAKGMGDCGRNSFSADTLVHSEEGKKPISEIKVGDKVLSYDERTETTLYQPVMAVIQGERQYQMVKLTLASGDSIEATAEHPFYINGKGWNPASSLKVGQALQLHNGTTVVINEIDTSSRVEKVYNLTVANTHNYFVGVDGVLVHNCIDTKTAGKTADDVIYVTKEGVALPPGPKYQIPDNYIPNSHRSGNYGENIKGKFKERLRIDPPTPPGQKGPNYSHYHKNGKGTHYSPRPGDKDPGF